MFRPNWIITAATAVSLICCGPDFAIAKDKNKGKGNGISAAKVKPGKKAVPPGQIKRYTRGAKLTGDVDFLLISDLSKWNMGPLGIGEQYIQVDNEILKVSDTMEVLAVVGLVSELTN